MLYRTSLPYTNDATDYYRAIADLPWAVWLDSCGRDRYDILTANPVVTLVTRGEQTEISDVEGNRTSTENPFELLRMQLGNVVLNDKDIKFAGGALGYWGYDLARLQIHLPVLAKNSPNTPRHPLRT